MNRKKLAVGVLTCMAIMLVSVVAFAQEGPGAAAKVFTPLILGLALIESLVIYALIIAFILVGKI